MPHLDPERLTLLALGEQPLDRADADHLDACAQCREDLDTDRHVAEIARQAEHLRDLPAPPAALWERIAAEALPAPPDELGAAPDGVAQLSPRRAPRPGRWRAAWAAAAALVIGVLGTAGVARLLSDDAAPARVLATAELLPQAGAPETAHGRAQVVDTGHGLQVVVSVEGMPTIPGYYTVWIYDGKSVMIPLGSPGSAALNLPPAAEDLNVFHVVDVSAQALGQQEHGRSVLQGALHR